MSSSRQNVVHPDCTPTLHVTDIDCKHDHSTWSGGAVDQNDPKKWDQLWAQEGDTSWRKDALASVYDRIAFLVPPNNRVIDIGGGRGLLAERLRKEKGCSVEVWEHSDVAISACREKLIPSRGVDLEEAKFYPEVVGRTIVSTEVFEHISSASLDRLLKTLSTTKEPCFFSVPNDRLGPAEEPQHARKWTAIDFKRFLKKYFTDVRVEVLGPPARLPATTFPSDRGQPSFLLGIVNVRKEQTVSMCMPARDEAVDIEKCLASFMGFADEIVVGIDPRTTDNTRELAEKYADHVFELTELRGPVDEQVPEGGFHFAHARNQCMDRCTSDWIFMTEAHENLWKGADILLHLDTLIEPYVDVCHVLRTGGKPLHRQQWPFPWLCRNKPQFRYKRSTHNTLEYGNAPHIFVPQIKTLHERVHEKDVERQKQRKVQNRVKLMEDWLVNQNEWSLHYLGAEWREWDSEKAIHYFREYLNIGTSGALRYHTRLVLAKELGRLGRLNEAEEVLLAAPADDWSRIEHWIFLGDIAFDREEYERALTFYLYAATKRGPAPLSMWWVDLSMYSWIPSQRLAMTYSALGNLEKAHEWATALLSDYAENDAPEEFVREAEQNIRIITEAIHGQERAAAE